jgi:hypothetical protein
MRDASPVPKPTPPGARTVPVFRGEPELPKSGDLMIAGLGDDPTRDLRPVSTRP